MGHELFTLLPWPLHHPQVLDRRLFLWETQVTGTWRVNQDGSSTSICTTVSMHTIYSTWNALLRFEADLFT
jgi:hypothetical protein